MMHNLQVRIYYEDTDMGGIVYYANYFKYMERARSEFLRELKVDQRALLEKERMIFVVRKASGEYLSSAFLDDELTVKTRITDMKRASFVMAQNIERAGSEIFKGECVLVCVNYDSRKAVPVPTWLRERLLNP